MITKIKIIFFSLFLSSIIMKGQIVNWQAGGNPNFPIPQAINTTNNFLGTSGSNNVPVRFGTQGQQRLFLDNTTGGVLGNVGIGSSFNSSFRPISLLHIAQDNNINTAGSIRNWMAPGAPSTYANTTGTGMLISNGDNVWLGLRHKGVWDANDAVLAWGDNGGPGTDYFRFVLNHWNIGGSPGGTNDGLEIMRFDPTSSYVGIGDFQINNQMTPRSKVHIHEDISLHPNGTPQSVWFQMTNNDFAPNPTANDGLRVGVLYQPNLLQTGNAFIYNQEDRHLIFSTNHATPNGTNAINNTQERMRITSIGAPTKLITGYGVYNPSGTTNTDFTRVAISLNPFNPIHRPLSLLHLGYGANSATTNLDGWRPWMDIGTFTNSDQGSSMYSGLKQSGTNDAVIGWGYVPSDQGAFATRMRVLFTTNSNVTTIAGSNNGIEAAHFWSDGNNTRMGVGDMQTPNVDPQNTLEIRSSAASTGFGTVNGSSGLRFSNLKSSNTPITNPGTGVLSVDENGDVVYVPGGAGSTTLGNACGDPINPLVMDWEIPLNEYNWRFTGQGDGSITNDVSIGYKCELPLPARISVLESYGSPTANNSIAGSFINEDIARNTNQTFKGVDAMAIGLQTLPKTTNIGGNFYAEGGSDNYGVIGLSKSSSNSGSSYGGYFETYGQNSTSNNNVGVVGQASGLGNKQNYGVTGRASNSTASNTGGSFSSIFSSTTSSNMGVTGVSAAGKNNTGGFFKGDGPAITSTQTNTGIVAIGGSYLLSSNAPNFPANINAGIYSYADCIAGPNNYAGYFQGNVMVSGIPFSSQNTFTTSDLNVKKEIKGIGSSLDLIGKLKPVSFIYDNTTAKQLNFSEGKNYGFIAQEVAEVFPELVKNMNVPATSDSLGNQVNPAVTLKSLNYSGLIPFAIGGIQELNQKQQEIIQILEKAKLSDAQVKTNVSTFNALNKIKQLSPVSYNFTNANVPQLSFGAATDYGFVAQQLETVYPELIDTVRIAETKDSLGNTQNPSVLLKTVNYKAMSALLTRAVQEQQLTIDSLKQANTAQDSVNNTVQNQIAQLTALMNACCQNTSTRTQTPAATNTVIDVELSDKDIIVLNQNVPNPFAEQTTIAYNVPEKSGFAQIIFNDMKGQIIKVIDIKTKGKGQLNVFANDLSTGMYTYSLYVDGKLIDTKKMVKTE